MHQRHRCLVGAGVTELDKTPPANVDAAQPRTLKHEGSACVVRLGVVMMLTTPCGVGLQRAIDVVGEPPAISFSGQTQEDRRKGEQVFYFGPWAKPGGRASLRLVGRILQHRACGLWWGVERGAAVPWGSLGSRVLCAVLRSAVQRNGVGQPRSGWLNSMLPPRGGLTRRRRASRSAAQRSSSFGWPSWDLTRLQMRALQRERRAAWWHGMAWHGMRASRPQVQSLSEPRRIGAERLALA